jgi:hypothetical protein
LTQVPLQLAILKFESQTNPNIEKSNQMNRLQRFDLLAICGKIREVRSASTRHTDAQYLFFGLWLSLVERLVRDQEAVGSNPTSPT